MICGSKGLHGVLPWSRPIDHDIGQVDFLGQRHLASDSPDGLGSEEAVTFLETSDLCIAISRDDDRTVDSLVDAGFEEQGHVVNHDGLGMFVGDGVGQTDLLACDTGVGVRSSRRRLVWFLKTTAPSSRRLRVRSAFSTVLPNVFTISRQAGLPGLTTSWASSSASITIAPHCLNIFGDGAFPGCDTACESDQNHWCGARRANFWPHN